MALGYRGRMLLFDAAHHHAEVARFNHHTHTLWRDGLLNRVGNLLRQPFLHLQAARKTSMRRGILLRPITLPLGM